MATNEADKARQDDEKYRTSDDNVTERSGPTIQEQADSVLRGEATSVDTGAGGVGEPEDTAEAGEPADQQPKKAAKSTGSKSTDK